MALVSAPVLGSRTSHQALQELERSSAPFKDQLAEAWRIVDVDKGQLNKIVLSDPNQVNDKYVPEFAAREEWALRWLLKKLHANLDISILYHTPWAFMHILILRIPLANAARILNNGKFMQLLEKTITCVERTVESEGIVIGVASGTSMVSRGSLDLASDSTSTLSENPMPPPHRRSNKRKRDDIEGTIETASKNSALVTYTIVLLRLLQYLKGMSKCVSSRSTEDAYASEHMKAALRTETVPAAKIVGGFLTLLRYSQEIEKSGLGHHSSIETGLEPILDFWIDRLKERGDETSTISDNAFSSHCLVPALSLLYESRRAGHSPNSTVTDRQDLRMVEELIGRHIVVPSRSSFSAPEALSKDQDKAGLLSFACQRLLDLLNPLKLSDIPIAVSDRKSGRLLQASVIYVPTMYEIIVKCSSQQGKRRKAGDVSWLESSFLELSGLIGMPLRGPGTKLSLDQAEVLVQLLDVALVRKVTLKSQILVGLAKRYCGLEYNTEHLLSWQVIERIISFDPNVLLFTTREEDQVVSASTEKKVSLLNALLEKITLASLRIVRGGKGDSYLSKEDPQLIHIRRHIVLPLIRGSAKARDLWSFINHWHQQLLLQYQLQSSDCERTSKGNGSKRVSVNPVWQDKDIQIILREILEHSLTSNQLKSLIVDLLSKLSSEDCNVVEAAYTVVECILRAIREDESKDALADQAKFLVDMFLRKIKSFGPDFENESFYWLLRCCSALIEGWPEQVSIYFSGKLQELDWDNIPCFRPWFENNNKDLSLAAEQDSYCYQRHFEKFSFVMSAIAISNDAQQTWGSNMSMTLEAEIKGLIKYIHMIGTNSNQIGPQKPQDFGGSYKIWDGDMNNICDQHVLALSITFNLLFRYPKAFLSIRSELRRGILKAIQSAAQVSEPCKHEFITFESMWNGVFESDPIVGSKVIKADLESLIVEEIEERGKSAEPLNSILCRRAIENFFRLSKETTPRRLRERVLKLIHDHNHDVHFKVLMPPSEQAGGLIRGNPQSALLSAVPLNVQTVDIRAYAQESISVVSDGCTHMEYRMIRKSIQRLVDLSSSDLIVATAYELAGADGATEGPPRPLMRPTLLILRAILSSLSECHKSDELGSALRRILLKISESIRTTYSTYDLCVKLDLFTILHVKTSWAISQWTVEQTLSALAMLLSPHSLELEERAAGTVYLRICQVLRTILSAHRLKLRGRFHLLLPILQSLLRGLFVPHFRGNSVQRAPLNRPLLLEQKGSTLGTSHATAYTRLLTSICDPSVSSVSHGSHRSKHGLTPAIDKARKLAGQFLQYILMEYARCQLLGTLAPDIKTCLMPGFYAIFDIVGPDGVRATSEAMDKESRAVFKDLWEDWKQFGRWKGV